MSAKDTADEIGSFTDELDLNTEIDSDSIFSEQSADKEKSPNKDNAGNNDTDAKEQSTDGELDGFFNDLNEIEQQAPALKDELSASSLGAYEAKKKHSSFKKPNINIVGIVKLFKNLFKWRLMVGVLAIILIAAGGWWLYTNKQPFFDWFNFSNLLAKFNTQATEEQDFIEPLDIGNQILVEEPIAARFKNFNLDSNGSWLIQLGSCLKTSCLKTINDNLQKQQVPTRFIINQNNNYNTQFMKVYAVDLYRYKSEAEAIRKSIYFNNSFGLNPTLEEQAGSFLLVIGYFPVSTFGINSTIERIKQQLEVLYPNLLIDIAYEKVEDTISSVQLGPFRLRNEAQDFLDILQQETGFQNAVLIRRQDG